MRFGRWHGSRGEKEAEHPRLLPCGLPIVQICCGPSPLLDDDDDDDHHHRDDSVGPCGAYGVPKAGEAKANPELCVCMGIGREQERERERSISGHQGGCAFCRLASIAASVKRHHRRGQRGGRVQ
jgi:hypothetical protein